MAVDWKSMDEDTRKRVFEHIADGASGETAVAWAKADAKREAKNNRILGLSVIFLTLVVGVYGRFGLYVVGMLAVLAFVQVVSWVPVIVAGAVWVVCRLLRPLVRKFARLIAVTVQNSKDVKAAAVAL